MKSSSIKGSKPQIRQQSPAIQIAPETREQPLNTGGLKTGLVQHSSNGDFSRLSLFPTSSPRVQAKLRVGGANHELEREADAFAERVVTAEIAGRPSDTSSGEAGGNELLDESRDTPDVLRPAPGLHLYSSGSGTPIDPQLLGGVLRSPGHPLDNSTREFMETRFGFDFGTVRIHDGADAAASAEAISATAFTYQEHLVFNTGAYQPGTTEGRRLIAHELTHVLQQRAGVSGLVQRQEAGSPPAAPAKVDAPGMEIKKPAASIEENLNDINALGLGTVSKLGVMTPGKLSIYKAGEKGSASILKEYKLRSSVSPPPYLYAVYRMQFVVFAQNKSTKKTGFLGKTNSALSDEVKAEVAQWEAQLNTNNWFENTADHDEFVKDHILGQIFALWVKDAATVAKEKAGGKGSDDVPPQPDWMPAWARAMNKQIKTVRAADPVSTDIPEIFGFYYSRNSLKWRAFAQMMYEEKKLAVYMDVQQKDKPADILPVLRDRLRLRQLSPDAPSKPGAPKDQPPEVIMGFRIKADLDKKITEARLLHKDDAALPHGTAIVTSEDYPGQVFLQVRVYITEASQADTPVPDAKATSQMKKGTLPTPLRRGTNIDDLFTVVKEATLALRGLTYKSTSSTDEKPDTKLEAFPAHIGVPAGREDFQTVTGATLDAKMLVNLAAVIKGNVLDETVVAYRGIYYTWDIYRASDIITGEESKTLEEDWTKRRGQMMGMFRSSGRLNGINPVIKEKKLQELNAFYKEYNRPDLIVDPTKPIGATALKQIRSAGATYGSDTKLTPEATLTMPSTPGEYVIYARAVSPPSGKTMRLPSEAFYVIKLVAGETLANEAIKGTDNEIAALRKQIAETEDDEKKKELEAEIKAIETREKLPLRQRTLDDITQVAEAKELALRLLHIYKVNAGKKVSMPAAIIRGETDENLQEQMLKLWFRLETKDRGTKPTVKLERMIAQLDKQAAGLEVLKSSIASFAGDMKDYTGGNFTPVTALVSKVTGEVYNLLTMLVIRDDDDGGVSAMLVDVTTKQTQAKYTGRSKNSRSNNGMREAVAAAYEDFGKNSKYGEGFIAYRVPGTDIKAQAVSKPGFKQQVLEVLGYVSMVAGLTALVLGTVVTGGALGVAVFALGVTAGVAGAVVSGFNIADRIANNRFEVDAAFAMDALNIAGPILMAATTLTKFAKLAEIAKVKKGVDAGRIVEGTTQSIGAIAKMHSLVRLEKAFAIVQKGEALVNLTLVGYQTITDLHAISKAYKDDPKKQSAMEWEVLKNAAVSGTLAMISLRNEFKPASAHMSDLEAMVNKGYKERNYIELMKQSGLYDEHGKFVDPALNAIKEQEAAAEAKQIEAAAKGETPADLQKDPSKAASGEPPADGPKPEEGPARNNDAPPVKEELPQSGAPDAAKAPDVAVPVPVPDAPVPVTPKTPPKQKATSKKKNAAIPPLEVNKPATMADGSTATLRPDGSVTIVSQIGKGKGRKGYEKRLLSGIKVGLKGWHRAHSQGQGTGSESPHGIFYAPPEVNLSYQNSGIESRIREIFRITPPEYQLTLTTVTKAHPNTDGKPSQRLASIEYKIEITEPGGQTRRILEADIHVEDSVTKPKVETSADSYLADALWSIRFGDGSLFNLSPKEFKKRKAEASKLEKQLLEMIDTLERRLKTATGKQKDADQANLAMFRDALENIYRDPHGVWDIKAIVDDALTKWYPKDPLVIKDAASYLQTWKTSINNGSHKHALRLIEKAGSWKALMKMLQRDPVANATTIRRLEAYRNSVVDRIRAKFQAYTQPGASTKADSDIDLNMAGNDAGRKMIEAEADMRAEFGKDWSNVFRLNFYTEEGRMLRFRSITHLISPGAFKSLEHRVTKRSVVLNIAKMLQHAKGNADSDKRVNRLLKYLSPEDAAEARRMADIHPDQVLPSRDKLLREVDSLQEQLDGMDVNDARRVELSEKVTMKQMEANFLTVEAYIGPGSMLKNNMMGDSAMLKFQKIFSNLEMIEHIISTTNGNIIKAAREYELYKYVNRISEAFGNKQQDLFTDYLASKIKEHDRYLPESISPQELQSLYFDYMNIIDKYLSTELPKYLTVPDAP